LQTKKEEIIEKAIILFSKNGYAETKISDITDALGVAKGTLYLYFGSKRELFLECVGRLTMCVIPPETWQDVRKERDFIERQRIKLREFLYSFPKFSGMLNLVRLSFQNDDPDLAKKARDTYKMLASPLTKDLQRAINEGVARSVDAEIISLLLMGMAENLGYFTLMDGRYSIEEGGEVLLDFMRRGLLEAKDPKPSAWWDVRDTKGFAVRVADIKIAGDTRLRGTIGDGELTVPVPHVTAIRILTDKEKHHATIHTKTGDQLNLMVDGRAVVSGTCAFGQYSIPLGKTSEITLHH
jgi:AcrR family transcriptional regulator